MKLPDIVSDLLHKKSKEVPYFFSLIVDTNRIVASVWEVGANGSPKVHATGVAAAVADTWEDRTDAADRALSQLEDKVALGDTSKVILGLPAWYLTEDGNIKKEIRGDIKKLTRDLELEPVGFVPLHQALLFEMKKEEGVPPSVILLGVTRDAIAVSLYKVGKLVGQAEIARDDEFAKKLEATLKSFHDMEVLPARMLLYGDAALLESTKTDLLRYPWTTRVNFLHFPKVETISPVDEILAVSFAGASELGSQMPVVSESEEMVESSAPAATPVIESAPVESEVSEEPTAVHIAVAGGNMPDDADVDDVETLIEEEVHMPQVESPDANVVMVDPETLGFQQNVDVLDEEVQMKESSVVPEEIDEELEGADIEEPQKRNVPSVRLPIVMPKIALPALSLPVIPKGSKIVAIVAGIVVLGLLGWGAYYTFPRATVTVVVLPKTVEATGDITIDPTASMVDPNNNVIPGAKQEVSESTTKTVPVTGKKPVGDPAKGTITIYNKSFDKQTFSKGTSLTAAGISFTLDSDVSVASASEDLAQATTKYGKANVGVTAASIGTQGNLPAGKEFVFKTVSSSVVAGRNDAALAGGNSREVTVVTRADYDAFVKDVTEELIQKAKQDLLQSVGSEATLIDDTVETTVTEKTFSQEIDQQATQLQGKLSLAISGIAYSQKDVQQVLSPQLSKDLPTGYSLDNGKIDVTVSDVTVKKDGKITATVTAKATALPTIDMPKVQVMLAGKSVSDAQELLRKEPGVGGMEILFRFNPTKNRLPINAKNISITVSLQ